MQTTCIHATGCVKITSHDSSLITKMIENISVDNLIPYGHYKAKVSFDNLKKDDNQKTGNSKKQLTHR